MSGLSFIISTCGRETLGRTLRSIAAQYDPSVDEVIVIGDTPNGTWLEDPNFVNAPGFCYYRRPPCGNWGSKDRQEAMGFASRSHLVFLDDDDALLPNAVQAIKKAVKKNPNRPLMFMMFTYYGLLLWKEKVVKEGNQGGQQFVTPNVKGMLGQWSTRYEQDFDFITSTLALYAGGAGAVVWETAIIVGCRQYGGKW